MKLHCGQCHLTWVALIAAEGLWGVWVSLFKVTCDLMTAVGVAVWKWGSLHLSYSMGLQDQQLWNRCGNNYKQQESWLSWDFYCLYFLFFPLPRPGSWLVENGHTRVFFFDLWMVLFAYCKVVITFSNKRLRSMHVSPKKWEDMVQSCSPMLTSGDLCPFLHSSVSFNPSFNKLKLRQILNSSTRTAQNVSLRVNVSTYSSVQPISWFYRRA